MSELVPFGKLPKMGAFEGFLYDPLTVVTVTKIGWLPVPQYGLS
jgi:hypothetical protein